MLEKIIKSFWNYFLIVSVSLMCAFIIKSESKFEFPVYEPVIFKETKTVERNKCDCEKDCLYLVKDCKFDLAYIAVKESFEFNKGDIFRMTHPYYLNINDFYFCKDNDNLCFELDEILNKRKFFKSYNKNESFNKK